MASSGGVARGELTDLRHRPPAVVWLLWCGCCVGLFFLTVCPLVPCCRLEEAAVKAREKEVAPEKERDAYHCSQGKGNVGGSEEVGLDRRGCWWVELLVGRAASGWSCWWVGLLVGRAASGRGC